MDVCYGFALDWEQQLDYYFGYMDLTLSQKELAEYGIKNTYAQMMFVSSADDYISSRCLLLNTLTPGFSLYAQSLEKFLKALIFLETGQRPRGHNPYNLKLQLEKHKSYNLDRFNAILQRLHGHFQTRYYDNADKSKCMSSEELNEFDQIWMHLFDLIPFPLEVKYRLKFPTEILDKRILKYWPSFRHWATLNNKSLGTKRLNQMERTYLAVKRHLHGT